MIPEEERMDAGQANNGTPLGGQTSGDVGPKEVLMTGCMVIQTPPPHRPRYLH